MRFLLDTVAVLHWLELPATSPRSIKSRLTLAPADLPMAVSVATIWEVAIKKGLGKLQVPDDVLTIVENSADFAFLPIAPAHAWRVRTLPFTDHKDPFDRVLAAQALEERLTIVSPDPHFARYGVPVAW